MKIVFFSFYFHPDIGAGSFRAITLANSLKNKLKSSDELHVITSHPNRYASYVEKAADIESHGNLIIHRIKVPMHRGSMRSQIITFLVFAYSAFKLSRLIKPDFFIGTSSRLMTALLTRFCSSFHNRKYYIDLRDIFSETIADVLTLKNKFIGSFSRFLFIFLEKLVLKSASGVNVVSGGFPEYFEKLGIDTSKWSFFPNGVDHEFKNLSLANNSSEKKKYNYSICWKHWKWARSRNNNSEYFKTFGFLLSFFNYR
jgi:hypothetical protein